ncbi:hypothetical protein GCM10009863_60400 [Streptomyces axinellae]|uniref:Acyl-CoA thioester hydrolase/bile acid-CoA amino acid N-acetyltransferase domain-containing protein n=2 Tax=Streptomyces axinellae TaxID=552788 RepID=A0ABP6D7Q6_9ACTN
MARATAVGIVAALAMSGCADGGKDDGGSKPVAKHGARLTAEPTTAPADEHVGARLSGLGSRTRVVVEARATDRGGHPWTAELTRTADRGGRVDLTKDTAGLLSGLRPTGGAAAKLRGSGTTFSYHPGPPGTQRSYKVRLTATALSGKYKGRRLAARTLTREWLTKGTTHRELTVKKDKVAGDLYLPAKGSASGSGSGSGSGREKAPVLVFGGSEGGNAGTYTAALLASHGHPAMSVCYFRCGSGSGRPNAIDMIDLDYFTHAGRILRAQDGADPSRLTVLGNSRGSEAAQLLGQRRPSVFRNVVAYAPSSKVNGPYRGGTVAWADHGKPIPTGPIPLNHVRGTVLAVAGGNDKMWGSAASARDMAARGAKKLVYPDAGHHVNWFPLGQPGEEGGRNGAVSATAKADQAARADSWPEVRKLLER